MTQNNMEVAAWQYSYEMWDGGWSAWSSPVLDKPTNPDFVIRPLVTLTSAQAEIERLAVSKSQTADLLRQEIAKRKSAEKDWDTENARAEGAEKDRDALRAIIVDCLEVAEAFPTVEDPEGALEYLVQELRDGVALQPLEPKND